MTVLVSGIDWAVCASVVQVFDLLVVDNFVCRDFILQALNAPLIVSPLDLSTALEKVTRLKDLKIKVPVHESVLDTVT
jgi:hypothetical protein